MGEDPTLTQPLLLSGSDKSESELTVANLSSLPMLAMPTRELNETGASRSKIGAFLRASTQDIHDLWKRFDLKFMRPYFGGRGFVPNALTDSDSGGDVEEGGKGGEIGDDLEREEGGRVGVIKEEEEGE